MRATNTALDTTQKKVADAYVGQLTDGPNTRSVGDTVRFVFKNELPPSSAVHFPGVEVPNAMDGAPFVTQPPVLPGKTFTYEFVANRSQVSMYHSHHHAERDDGMFGMVTTFIVKA